MRPWWGLLVGLGGLGCAFLADAPPEFVPDTQFGVQVTETEGIVAFHASASAFYGRLVHRRFNTLSTFQDPKLRAYFRTTRQYSDYYADLADALRQEHFEKSRPLGLEITEFRMDGPGRARVRVRIVGENGLPLRWWETGVEREDRWERSGGRWWIVPGKL